MQTLHPSRKVPHAKKEAPEDVSFRLFCSLLGVYVDELRPQLGVEDGLAAV